MQNFTVVIKFHNTNRVMSVSYLASSRRSAFLHFLWFARGANQYGLISFFIV